MWTLTEVNKSSTFKDMIGIINKLFNLALYLTLHVCKWQDSSTTDDVQAANESTTTTCKKHHMKQHKKKKIVQAASIIKLKSWKLFQILRSCQFLLSSNFSFQSV